MPANNSSSDLGNEVNGGDNQDDLPPILNSPETSNLPPKIPPADNPISSSELWVRYEGFWGLDVGFTVTMRFDQGPPIELSFKEPINLKFPCEPGLHVLEVKLGWRAVRVYQLQITESGVYAADLDYNSAWGNFSETIYLSRLG